MTRELSRRKFISNLSAFTVSTIFLPLSACTNTAQKIRFGLTTDSHYANREPAGTRYYRQSLEKMQEFVDIMNQEEVDFIIHLGDFKDEDPNKKAKDTLSYLSALEEIYASFKGPKYHCVGNHDVDSITKAQFLANIENTGIPKDKSYYSYDQNGFHFIALDANYHPDGKDHFYLEGANWQETHIPDFEIEWLKKDLAANDKPTIVFCHHPLFEYYAHESTYHVDNYQKIQDLLIQSNVIGVFQGHVHDERFEQINDIHYITQFGMVDYEGISNNSFAIVEINNKGIQINGYKRSNSKNLI